MLLGEDAGRWAEASPLEWFSTRRYQILRTPQAPELRVRAVPAFPVSDAPDAVLRTRESGPDGEVLRWRLMDGDGEPVQLAEPTGRSAAWVLRADESYDLDYDVEQGWQVFSHPEPDGP